MGDVFRFAVEQVPAYRHLLSVVERLSPSQSIQAFPLLTKDDLQSDLGKYLPRCFENIPHYECTTGGTSGNQLTLYLDDNSQSVEMAFMHRQWARVGYTPSHRKATFRGVAFQGLRPGIYWQENPIYREMQFSPFHMSDKTLDGYLEQFIAFKPAFVHGYPSAVDILAEYVLRKGLRDTLPVIKAALLGSEACMPEQRERIERAFGTRVFTWYGHSERVVLGGECEVCPSYHQFPDYGYLEITRPDGTPCEVGERGEIVGTGFLNRSLPLIRYRTGDYAIRCEPDCACGRHWDRFSNVEGRWEQDMVVGKNGARISIAALNMHGPMFRNVLRYQYYQNVKGKMEIRILPAPAFSVADESAIARAYEHKVGEELDITVRTVSDIPLTTRGKLKRLVSELDQGC